MTGEDTAEAVDPNKDLVRALRILTTELQEDADYRRAWTANIAMAFKDEYNRVRQDGNDFSDLHAVANNAAEHFINMLCMDRDKPEAKGSFSAVMDQIRRAKVSRDVQTERDRQDTKWGLQNIDPFKFLTILMEEVGESSRAVIEAHNFHFDSWDDEKLKAYREEMIQVAAVAQQAVEAIDRDHWQKPEIANG